MKTTQITKHLELIERQGYTLASIYHDWFDMMVYSLVGDEKAYMETVGRYKRTNNRPVGERAADHFASAYAELIKCWKDEYCDYLGELYEEHVTHGEHGQFFTPEPVATLTAEITCRDLQNGQSVCDPACGSGRMLLAASRINPRAIFYGIDLDQRCVAMAVLNFVHKNITAYVVCGNTLSLEHYKGFAVKSSPFGATVRYLTEAERTAIMGQLPAKKQEAPQLALF